MTKENFKIVFMGTPEFAVETLRLLVENNYNVLAVVTMPDKPAGRGHKLQQSAVKKYATSQNLPVLQPDKLKDETFVEHLKSFEAQLNIVVAFRMLPEIIWNMPQHGTYNLHASLLPQYRGAAPINWAIINGETETGVTTFKLVHEIDAGKIAYQSKIAINKNDNAGIIHDKLMYEGAKLVLKTVDAIIDNSIVLESQEIDDCLLKPAPKIFKETCKIDWSLSSHKVDSFIRGLSPYPAAQTQLIRDDKKLGVKIFNATPILENHTYIPGTIVQRDSSELLVAVADGFMNIIELQLQGKKRMKTKDFLNGFSIQDGDYFL